MGVLGKMKRYLKHISLKKEKVDNPVLYGSLLDERAALVTGGTSGIGLAIAEAFARNGAAVAITGRSQERIDFAIQKIRSKIEGARIVGLVLDNSTSDEAAFARALDEAESALGCPLDALVNNAGVIAGGSVPNTEMVGFDLTVATNLRGPFFLSQVFARRLIEARRTGNILNVCSSSSLRPAISPYTVSKWGLRGLTMGLAKSLIPHGIVVNGIAPGPTATPMLMADGDDNLVHPGVPAGRYATAEEIANMSVVLVSDLSRMVVGDIVYMTGGCGNLTYEDMDYTVRF